jgi:site-specific DNA-methyltransferase (adenine-specific)
MSEPISIVECCDNMEFMAKFPDKYFELAIVDPPYGIGVSNSAEIGYKGLNIFKPKDWDNKIPTDEYFDALSRVSKNQIIWGGNYFLLKPSRCFIVWDKGEGFYGRTYAECEMAWTSFDLNAKIYKRDPLARGDYHGKIHPTQKPMELYVWLLQKYAKTGDKILDTHLGSQSSRIAAWEMGFDFWGCVIDEDYFKDGCNRFEKVKAQGKLF